jgi:predicted Zn-dependent protease
MRAWKHRYAALGLCAAALAAAGLVAGCRTNPVTGQSELVLVQPQEELALGDELHPNVIFSYDGEYLDPELKRYLGTIVMRLHACSHRPDMPTDFTVVNTSVVNAFAIPGHVYATRGFIAHMPNEAQFAAVMGHELAHVAAGHTAKELTNKMLTGLVFNAADYAAGGSAGGKLAAGAGQVGIALVGLSYSREQEIQADRVGAYYMALAGWDPRQAVEMEKLLDSLGKSNPTALDRYLSTHPPSADRVREVQAVIYDMKLQSGRYVQGDGVYAERWLRHTARLREEDRAFAGRPAEAKAAYNAALARDRRYVLADNGLGKVLLQQGDYAAAETEFAAAAHGYPNSLVAWYGLGVARYRLARYRDAAAPLEKVVGSMPNDPMVRYMLAVCYDETSRPADAYAAYREALSAGLSGPEREHALSRVGALQAYAGAAQ